MPWRRAPSPRAPSAARGAASSVQRGVPTSGRIANGAMVEREVPFELAGRDRVRLSLRNPDLTTARRIAAAINRAVGSRSPPRPTRAPWSLITGGRDVARLLTDIEQLRVEPDQAARVIIEEASGTIVMGANVRISTVAIAQGNLTIRVTETPQVQPARPALERRDGGGAAHRTSRWTTSASVGSASCRAP